MMPRNTMVSGASGVPGSLVVKTLNPLFCKYAVSFLTCVDFPHPSTPSKHKYLAFLLIIYKSSLEFIVSHKSYYTKTQSDKERFAGIVKTWVMYDIQYY